MKRIDSRRLTGPGLIQDVPGAVLDVALEGAGAREVTLAWRDQAVRMLEAVGWPGAELASRSWPDGVTLALTAPEDCLYAATEVNEWAFDAAAAILASGGDPGDAGFERDAARLREAIDAERNPAFLSLARAAAGRGVSLLHGDGEVSVGLGAGSVRWPEDGIPAPGEVDWTRVSDVPVVLVSGTNGKTTTVRLLGAVARAAGLVDGTTSSDGIAVNGEIVEAGDYSGPEGARAVLRDRRVEFAVLEVARGGILRRGLPTRRATAAVVTNVAADHLGEYGVHTVEDLADTKMVVARVVPAEGRIVLNGADPRLVERAGLTAAARAWFTTDPRGEASLPPPARSKDMEAGTRGGPRLDAWIEDGSLVLREGPDRSPLVEAAAIPVTMGGAARHNVDNALAAILAARASGLSREAIVSGLTSFRGGPSDNPGRGQTFTSRGVTVIVDFAHNPHGLRALLETARRMPAERRLVVIGQAGDRDDEAIRDLARAAWSARPDLVVVKEMKPYLRGRAEGEIPALLEDELLRQGAPREAVTHAGSEADAARRVLEAARPGDLVLLTTHADRDGVRAAVETWMAAGDAAPDGPGSA